VIFSHLAAAREVVHKSIKICTSLELIPENNVQANTRHGAVLLLLCTYFVLLSIIAFRRFFFVRGN
jgi:hypothetical protein